jgi:hypothetical protein
VLLIDQVANSFVSGIESLLSNEEFFVAEQIGIPVLYEELWKYSNGPTRADHAFHEFIKIREAKSTEVELLSLWGTTKKLFDDADIAAREWDCSLSVHGSF